MYILKKMGQDTVRHRVLKNRFISILLGFLILSWTGFLVFSDVTDQMYWYSNYSRIDTFIAREKVEVPSLSGGPRSKYLVLEDKSGRLITMTNVTPSYWSSISRNEVIRVRIEGLYISNIKHTSFQICVMWCSFIFPFLLILITRIYNEPKLICGINLLVVALIYFIIGLVVTIGLW